MSWHLDPDGQREMCPEEFQDRLTAVGGVNKYDQPNFLIAWGQTHTYRAGGLWEGEGFPTYLGYRDLLLGMGEPAWMLLMWNDPLIYGTPELWYLQNYDETTGLQILGEYPYMGRYEIVSTMTYKHVVNGELHVERMPLSSLLLDLVIPSIFEAQGISMEKRKARYLELKKQEDDRMGSAISDSLKRKRAAFGASPVSYAGQICKENEVHKRAAKLAQGFQDAMQLAQQLTSGNKTPGKRKQFFTVG